MQYVVKISRVLAEVTWYQKRQPIESSLSVHQKQGEMKLLSRVRLFATPWTVACTRLLRPWEFLGKTTGVGCHFLLQGIFPTQGSNPGLLHCRQILYRQSHHTFKQRLEEGYFSLSVPLNHLGVLLNCRFGFSRCRV